MRQNGSQQKESEESSENTSQAIPNQGSKSKVKQLKRRGSSSSEETVTGDPVKEFVREDVFLMENKAQRINTNLLANSLRARVRHSVPDNVNVGQAAMNKLRRESVKNFVYLDNLNKQYTGEMNWESNRLDKESNKLVKRHHNMRKHSEQQKKNQEQLESQLRTRSGFSSVSLLPRLVDSSASGTFESPDQEKDKKPDFSDFDFVDKDDQSFVKVFKYKGIFQRQNKYGNRNDLDLLKQASAPPQEEDSDDPVDLPYKSKSRKGLSVTWSSQSQYYSNDGNSDIDLKSPSRCDTRTETLVSSMSREITDTPDTTISMRSVKSDSFMWRKPKYSKGKSNVNTIGLKWQVPAEGKLDKREKQPRNRILHVRNLNPVTKALDREGTSPTRMKWQVHQMRSPSAMDMYMEWIEKLDNAKRSPSSLSKSPDLKPRSRMSYVKMPAVSVHV